MGGETIPVEDRAFRSVRGSEFPWAFGPSTGGLFMAALSGWCWASPHCWFGAFTPIELQSILSELPRQGHPITPRLHAELTLSGDYTQYKRRPLCGRL